MKKETLVSIAERSGCSISTVSRVLSGNAAKYRISQRTVARVTEEVKRCNYTPSLLAKGLRTNRTDTIGLLIPNIENSFFAGVAGVVIRESRNYNYKVVVVDTQEDERNEQDGLSALLARRVDGIVAGLLTVALVLALPDHDIEPVWFWLGLAAAWGFAWLFVERLLKNYSAAAPRMFAGNS